MPSVICASALFVAAGVSGVLMLCSRRERMPFSV
jgi:hypothetical protein